MQFIIAAIIWIVGLYFLYIVILSAIDNSEATRLLREIKDLLKGQNKDKSDNNSDVKIINYDLEMGSYELCPACEEKISPNDKECHSCGLTLIDEN